VQSYEQQAQEAEKVLATQDSIPDASMFNFKFALEHARRIIDLQKLSLAGKRILEQQNERLQEDVRELSKKNERLEAAYSAEQKRGLDAVGKILAENDKVRAELEAAKRFIQEPDVHKLYIDYLQWERQLAARKPPAQQQERKQMTITTAQVKEIRLELAKLKPAKITLDGMRSLTVKEAVYALAPTLERMRKRGFDAQELAEKLHEKGIEIKAPTLAKYLNEFRREQARKTDRPAPLNRTATPRADAVNPVEATPGAASQPARSPESICIRQDTPIGDYGRPPEA